jgi:hypothetical protein
MADLLKWAALIIWTSIVVLIVLPPRYDPAVRLKEWVIRRRGGRS